MAVAAFDLGAGRIVLCRLIKPLLTAHVLFEPAAALRIRWYRLARLICLIAPGDIMQSHPILYPLGIKTITDLATWRNRLLQRLEHLVESPPAVAHRAFVIHHARENANYPVGCR